MMDFAHKPQDLQGLKRLIVLAGPTGVGKTALSLELASRLNAEIVSVDSLQVYRHLDIGTAKVSREERAQVAHHLIDVVDPDEDFNAGDYKRLAMEAIADIQARGKVPLLVGGTGLYVRLLVHGLVDLPEPDEEMRARLYEIAAEKGAEHLYENLKECDPVLAEKIHPNDLVRITRGLEVFEQTGKPLSLHQQEHRFSAPNFNALKIALIRPREELYDRINRRVEVMLEEGLIEEYRRLLEMGYGRGLKPMMSLGYKQIGDHIFDGRDLAECVEEIQVQTRRYAKQQISWFRGEPDTHWAMAPVLVDGELPGAVIEDLGDFLEGRNPGLEWAGVDPYNVRRQ